MIPHDDQVSSKLAQIRLESNPVAAASSMLAFDLDTVVSHRSNQDSRRGSSSPVAHDVRWMEAKVNDYYAKGGTPAGMALAELVAVLVKILTSKKTSDELQMELFELLGFDRIDLIQLLLVRRFSQLII